MTQKYKLWLRSVIIAIVSLIISLLLNFFGVFNYFENKTYDLRMVNAAKYKQPCDDICFICIDQESIDWAKDNYGWSWPWPRKAYASIIDFISIGNPKAIAFDILYTEPSVYGSEDDVALGEAEAKSKKVIQTFFLSENDYEKPLFPVDSIKQNAALLGSISSKKDSDDIIRRTPLSYCYDGLIYPSLGMAPIFLHDKNVLESIKISAEDTVRLRYTSSIDDYHPYSAKDILESYDALKNGQESVLLPEDFDDLYIFVALYAPGLFDICSTPVSQVYPGVGVHITALDNYLTSTFIKESPFFVDILWMLILSLFASALIAICENRFARYSSVLISIGLIVGFAISIIIPTVLFNNGIWIELVAPLFCFLISGFTGVILSLSIEGKQKRFIRSAFSQCLSKDVVNQIINDSSSFTLGGKKFQMSAIFTDIQKFSSFSELLSASQLGSLLNYYLTIMSDIIIEEKGTVDKYEGDAIVALVGAPVQLADHAKCACRAAIKMKQAEVKMNQDIINYSSNPKPNWMEEDLYNAFLVLVKNKKTIFTRIGINSGEMIAGYFGSEKKKNYTMMGNNVNLASRLEGVNKQYHTNGILISQATKELLDEDFVIRSLDKVRVVNINTPIQLYEVLETKENASSTLFLYIETWENAMKEFNQQNYGKAKDLLLSLIQQNQNDNVAKYYLHLLEKYFLQKNYPKEIDNEGVEFLPDENVFRLLQK